MPVLLRSVRLVVKHAHSCPLPSPLGAASPSGSALPRACVSLTHARTFFRHNKRNRRQHQPLSPRNPGAMASSQHKDGDHSPGTPRGDPEDATEGLIDKLQGLLSRVGLGASVGDITLEDEQPPHATDSRRKLRSLDLAGVAEFIRSGRCRGVVLMLGAGASTSAGIPDFRTPGTGLYSNLQKYNLPEPTSIFDIEFFRENPRPFFTLARELYPGLFKPTPTHYFIRMLAEKGLLVRAFTQNIDTLERIAGIPSHLLVEAHGSFATATCTDCRTAHSSDYVKDAVFSNAIPTCTACEGVVKPDIVFFGESLPRRFFELAKKDFPEADLLIIAGTSLVVHPFASLVDFVERDTPRLLINREKCGQVSDIEALLTGRQGLAFDKPGNYRDVCHLGACDEGFFELARLLDWDKELRELVDSEHARIEKEYASLKAAASSAAAAGEKEEKKSEEREGEKAGDSAPPKEEPKSE